MPGMEDVRLSIRDLDKSFSAPVLQGINLSIEAGEIHAIVGENGAGKSTLVNILAGLLQKDGGDMFMDGVNYEPGGPRDGFAAGIACVAQELSTIATLSVAENIALKSLPHKNSVILKDELDRQAAQLLQLVGLDHIAPNSLAGALSLAERQLLELAKALATDCRLLVLDEPTSALTAPQADHLHEILADLAAAGTAVIYISHRLDDILRVSNRVTVLRDGRVITTAPADSLSVPEMMEKMSGQKQQNTDGFKAARHGKETVLAVENITTGDLPHPISFACHSGEIIGIAGLAGSGRSELLAALFGVARLTGGCVRRCTPGGKTPIRSAGHAVKTGMGFLGEDRQSMGLFVGQSILANITLPGISRVASTLGLIDGAREAATGAELVERLAIKCDSVHQDIGQLSGGNQQKVLIARWIYADSDIFLLDEPTRGVDVGTKNAIYELMFELQGMGKTILVASSELDELLRLSGRIFVLSNRRLVKEFARDECSEETILAAAFQEFVPNLLSANESANRRQA